ncbi:MAG: hypothetical protein U1E36_02985 [Rickettsiales bacterium]
MSCTPTEKFATEVGSLTVQAGSTAIAIAVTGISLGTTTPIGYGIIAGGNIAAEAIRAYCSDNPIGNLSTSTAKEAGSIGVSVAANALVPGSGIAARLIDTGASFAYSVAVGDIQEIGVGSANGAIIPSQETVDPAANKDLSKPKKLFPDNLPALSAEQKRELREVAAHARKSIVEAHSEKPVKGHGLTQAQKTSQIENGIY